MKDISLFQERVGVKFNDLEVLRTAFTHRSYLNEHRKGFGHNERFEFLGDAVLELVVTDILFRKYPEKNEGDLTSIRAALVNAHSLSRVAHVLGVNDYLLLSRGEQRDIGRARQIILADTMEAIIGAIYVDQGLDVARVFIEKHILATLDIEDVVKRKLWLDAKSYFQERAQEVEGITPTYKVLKEEGPDHSKSFTVGIFIRDEQVALGVGMSKQEAEQQAAIKGLEVRGWR